TGRANGCDLALRRTMVSIASPARFVRSNSASRAPIITSASPVSIEPDISRGTGRAIVVHFLIVLIENVLAAQVHLPGLIDLVFGVEVDADVRGERQRLV